MMRNPNIKRDWTIFTSLYEAVKEREFEKLRLAKCAKCGRATPYRLKSLGITSLRCRRCEASTPVMAGEE